MPSEYLSTDEFLSRLTTLFQSRAHSSHGSVYLTQKRLTPSSLPALATDTPLPPSSPYPFADLAPPHPLPILIRATDGKSQEDRKDRVKFSTVVQAEELVRFFARYADICKGGMAGLKKRDRSGRKKGKKKGKGGEGEKKKG